MYRCVSVAALAVCLVANTAAQSRVFPQNTLRGAIVFGEYPSVTLNGRATSLTPGARVRDQRNSIVQAASLAGGKLLVHYTMDMGGEQVRDVWILTPDESAIRPWPTNLRESQTWLYDATTMTWTRP